MGWEKTNATQKKEEALAYIDGATLAAAKEDGFVKDASDALLKVAKDLMNDLDKNNLTTQAVTFKEGKPYTNKAVVSVEKATAYDKESQTEKQLYHKDGSDVYSLKITIPNGNDALNLYAKEDISEGIKLQNMSVKRWEKGGDGVRRPTFIKREDIADASCRKDTKAIAEFVEKSGLIAEKAEREYTPMQKYAYELNQYFNQTTDKVPSFAENDNGEQNLVNDAYAKYIKDDFGERIRLASHSDKIVVELGKTSDGKTFAKATNFDIPLDDGKGYASQFINKAEDLADLGIQKDIAAVVASYKEEDFAKAAKADRDAAKAEKPPKMAEKAD